MPLTDPDRRAEDSALRRLAALVEIAETGRHRYSGLADRTARLYAPVGTLGRLLIEVEEAAFEMV
mgnify:CR=1 FL=1